MEKDAREGASSDQQQRHVVVVAQSVDGAGRVLVDFLGRRAGFGPVLRDAPTGLPVQFAAVGELRE